jgi:hypothetical protein
MDEMTRLLSGRQYKVRYQIPGLHKKPREMVAVYLSFDERPNGLKTYFFSGRPEFGTTEVKQEHILWWIEAPAGMKPYHSRKVNE